MKKQTAADIKISGTFNVKRFYETLAMIISNKENLSITVTVHETGEKRERAVIQMTYAERKFRKESYHDRAGKKEDRGKKKYPCTSYGANGIR